MTSSLPFVVFASLFAAIESLACKLNNSISVPIGVKSGGYVTSPEAGIQMAFFDDLCTVFVPLRPGLGVLLKADNGNTSFVSTGEFQTAYELPAYVDVNGTVLFATSSSSSGSTVCAYCSLNKIMSSNADTNSSVRGWSARSVCKSGSGQIWRSSFAFILPLLPAPAFAVINAYSLTIGGTLDGIRVLNGSTGAAFNGTARYDQVEALTPLRGATLPIPVIGVFLVGSAYTRWSVATVTNDNRLLMAPGALPNRTQLQERSLEVISASFEPYIFCFNRTTVVALSALELFVGAPRWSTVVDGCSGALAAATLSGDIVLASMNSIYLIDGASGGVLATDPRGALGQRWGTRRLRVLPRTGHIHVSFVSKNTTTNEFSANAIVFDDQLQFVRNVSLFPEEAAVIANISTVSSIDIMVNPITGDKFVTVSAYPNLDDNRLFAWPCNATADATACAPPPSPISRIRPTTTTTTTTTTSTVSLTSVSFTSVVGTSSGNESGTITSSSSSWSVDNSSSIGNTSTNTQAQISGSLISASIGSSGVPSPSDDDDIWAPPSGIGFVIACGVGGGIAVVVIVFAGWFACRRRQSTLTRFGEESRGALLQDQDHR